MRKVKQKPEANRVQKVKEKRNFSGVPGAIRTLDPLLRRQLLCPAELQGHYTITIQYLVL